MSQAFFLLPEDVAEIVAILDGTAYDSLDIQTGRFRLRVARSGAGWTQTWEHAGAAEAVAGPAAGQPATETPAEVDGIAVVRTPLPGVFYRAPQPGAPPFTDVGSTVAADSVVGIVETMKVMNSVAAGVAGEVVEIVAPNGAHVDPDTVLMRVRMK